MNPEAPNALTPEELVPPPPIEDIRHELLDMRDHWKENPDAQYTNEDTQHPEAHPDKRFNRRRAAWFAPVIYWVEQGTKYIEDPIERAAMMKRIGDLHERVIEETVKEHKIHGEEVADASAMIEIVLTTLDQAERTQKGAA